MNARAHSGWPRRLVVLVPYLWLAIFFAIPFLIVLRMSVSQSAIASPPYLPLLDMSAGWEGIKAFAGTLSLDNFRNIFSDSIYTYAYLKSLQVATISTALLMLIGFPIAYGMSKAPRALHPVLVMAVILPFWTAFLIRIYAWVNILQRDGLLNDVLLALRIIDEPVGWLASDTAIYIGVVYSYLPFMVLPIYSALEKLDDSLLEAAADLGCPRWKAFWVVTVPLALPGIAAGALLCFIPVIGEFVIPDLLGGSGTMMIGQMLWVDFFANLDWPAASAIAIVLLALLLVPIIAYQHLQTRALAGGR